jgi:hypothetical protein
VQLAQSYQESGQQFFAQRSHLERISIYFEDPSVLKRIRESRTSAQMLWLVQAITEFEPGDDENVDRRLLAAKLITNGQSFESLKIYFNELNDDEKMHTFFSAAKATVRPFFTSTVLDWIQLNWDRLEERH